MKTPVGHIRIESKHFPFRGQKKCYIKEGEGFSLVCLHGERLVKVSEWGSGEEVIESLPEYVYVYATGTILSGDHLTGAIWNGAKDKMLETMAFVVERIDNDFCRLHLKGADGFRAVVAVHSLPTRYFPTHMGRKSTVVEWTLQPRESIKQEQWIG